MKVWNDAGKTCTIRHQLSKIKMHNGVTREINYLKRLRYFANETPFKRNNPLYTNKIVTISLTSIVDITYFSINILLMKWIHQVNKKKKS